MSCFVGAKEGVMSFKVDQIEEKSMEFSQIAPFDSDLGN